MIPLDKPELLPVVVAGLRKARGLTRRSLARDFAPRSHRAASSVDDQWAHWEGGQRVPRLDTIGPYLVAHGLRLYLGSAIGEELPGCQGFRLDARRTRCALPVGHGGRHRTYNGTDF